MYIIYRITPGVNVFSNHENLVHLPIYCKFCLSNDILTIFPIQMHGISKIGQGHTRVMIYTKFVDLHSWILHAKFQNHSPPGSEEEDFLRCLLFIDMVTILVM